LPNKIIVINALFFGLVLVGLIHGCASRDILPADDTSSTSGEQYPFDTGGEALVVAETAEVYDSLYGTEIVHTLEFGDRVTLIAEFNEVYLEGWRKIIYGDNNAGWVKTFDRSRFRLLYYVVSENSKLSSEPGEKGIVIASLPIGSEVEISDLKIAEGNNWAAVRCEQGEGWVLQSDLADGLLGLCELSYLYGERGELEQTLKYLKRAERAGAFVDYSNAAGPYVIRVPGRIFRVFGNGADYLLKENSVGSVAVDKTGKYLAFGREEDAENYLRVYDLKATDEVFYSPDLKDFRWSPLGQFLAYTDGIKGVYSLRMYWTSRGTVMKSFRLGGDYGWSPDGYLVAFTGVRDAESAEYYLPETDELPLDNVFTTVELYDPFAMLWSEVAVSTPGNKYEFAGWKSKNVIYVNEYSGTVDKSGIVRYEKEPRIIEWPIDRGTLISPRLLDPGYVAKKESDDGGSIDDSDLSTADKADPVPSEKPENPQ